MAIAFRASSAASANSGNSQTGSQAITIPAAVQSGDVIFVLALIVVLSASAPTLSASSTGTAPSSAGSPVSVSESGPVTLAAQVFKVIAGGSDAGKVITLSSTASGFWSVAMAAWSGASSSAPVDVIGGATSQGSSSVTCPSKTTGVSGDWAVFMGGGALEAGGTLTLPAGTTQRENDSSDPAEVATGICDSNGSVGGSGTSIGGGTFSCAPNASNLLAAFTIGLAPPSGTSHTATASLTVTPSFAVTKGLGLVQAMTVTPSFKARKGLGKVPRLTVAPVFATTRVVAHTRTGTLALAPVFRAVPSGGAAKGGGTERHHRLGWGR